MKQCTCHRADCLSYHEGETYETRILRLTTASEAREERISSGARCEACVFDTQCEACYERAEIREYQDTMNEARYPSAEEVAAWELELGLDPETRSYQ